MISRRRRLTNQINEDGRTPLYLSSACGELALVDGRTKGSHSGDCQLQCSIVTKCRPLISRAKKRDGRCSRPERSKGSRRGRSSFAGLRTARAASRGSHARENDKQARALQVFEMGQTRGNDDTVSSPGHRLRECRAPFTLCLVLAAIGSVFVWSPRSATAAPTIVTDQGPITGLTLSGEDEYLGIPYASPPVSKLRWLPPQPPARFNGVFQATEFGSLCTQPDGFGGTFGSEDCLTLNIYRPSKTKHRKNHHGLPVMVWIPGGGLVTGGGGFYDPTRIVKQAQVIVVSINYRLGFLGFFAHPAIDAEGHLSGNYGLMDQQFALSWVQRNIEAFGGDPKRVTIFGESAGGQSVYANLASPSASGLFSRAIAESGAYTEFQSYYDFIVSLAEGETVGTSLVPAGTTVATNVGCSNQTAACLRSVPASTIIEQDPAVIYPFVDGTILTETPSEAFESGEFNRVPVITGGNHDEWRYFVASQYDATGHPLVTSADYETATIALWGSVLGPILDSIYYPLAFYPSPGVALGASGTDGIFACPERNSVRALSTYTRTYAYEFNDEKAYRVFDIFPAPLYPPITFPLGAAHFTEVPYLFRVYFTPSRFRKDQKQLSNSMIRYWTTFAASGNPNSAAEPHWSRYRSTRDEFLSLVPPTPMVESTFDADHKCSLLWDALQRID
jgi:para-nitrobenzyl esterase